MKIYIYFTLLVVLLSSCVEEISSLSLETGTAVVEGYLHAGQPLDSLKITQSFSYANPSETLITLDDLEVIISDEEQPYLLTNIGNGIYQDLNFIPQVGSTYNLEFVRGNTTVNASTFIPELKPIAISTDYIELEKIEFNGGFPSFGGLNNQPDPVEVTWDNVEGDYYYTTIENLEDNPEFVNDILAEFEANGLPVRFFQISRPEITDFFPINPRQLTQYGTYRIIVFRVNPEYVALFETSGTSSLAITQPPTNVINGLGIFTGTSSDTLYLEVAKL